VPPYKDLRTFATLKRIVARLRGPRGCPWDRKQTSQSLKTTFLEECYEALQAMEDGDPQSLKGELGDLSLHILLQAQIAQEAGQFDIGDVFEGISRKLIRRHPHVFGDAEARTAEEVAANWEVIKQGEKNGGEGLLSSVPAALPALARAQSIQRRAAGVGFDWPEAGGVFDKVNEELGELRAAASPAEKADEFGDLLFALVNAGRWLDIDPEAALRSANERFTRRFGWMENACRQRKLDFTRLSLEEKEALWQEAKRALRAG
jgi:tetrapyrrole methylase family protein/MazG family protein